MDIYNGYFRIRYSEHFKNIVEVKTNVSHLYNYSLSSTFSYSFSSSTNPFQYIAMLSVFEIVSVLLATPVNQLVGRRHVIGSTLLLAGALFLAVMFVPEGAWAGGRRASCAGDDLGRESPVGVRRRWKER